MSTQAEQFDAVVIGSGQAGNPLAVAMMKQGWKTAVIERRYPGGTCVNDGCTPSKTIDASARVAYLARRGSDFGVGTGDISIDLHTVWERKQKIVLASRKNNGEGVQGENGTLILGHASFSEDQPGGGQTRISVNLQEGGTRELLAARVFLNTGERPHPPEVDGLDTVPYLDSTSIMELQEVPEHLVILGAGYIALEFAQMFLRFGAKVTVLERGERLAAHEDDDVAACLRSILEEDGIRILTCSAVTRVSGEEDSVSLDVEVDGKPQTVTGSHLLVATGRTPNVESLHLERVGVKQKEHGYIEVNDRLETSAPGIWALGDVKGGPAFTHISYDDFRIIRANLLEGGNASIKDRLVNYVMFTDPELARVGLSETEAAKQGKTVRVAEVPMKMMARANQMAEPRGMIKALVDPETRQILGATVLGVDGGEVMTQIQIAMWGKLPYTVLREGVFAHPTKSEVLNTLFGHFRDGQA
ncbi:MAG: mercuric reductase [Janthinobacterium lividum]